MGSIRKYTKNISKEYIVAGLLDYALYIILYYA